MGLCEWRVYNSVLKGIFVVAGGKIFFFFAFEIRRKAAFASNVKAFYR